MQLFEDGRIWVNIGSDSIHSSDNLRNGLKQLLDYQAVDLTKYNYEVYLVFRSMFNKQSLFVVLVMEHKSEKVFEYIRKDGPYWEQLKERFAATKFVKDPSSIKDKEEYSPSMEVIVNGATSKKTVHQTALFGIQHPNRNTFGLSGGACPAKGGDFGRYPAGDSGAGWPTNYQVSLLLSDGEPENLCKKSINLANN